MSDDKSQQQLNEIDLAGNRFKSIKPNNNTNVVISSSASVKKGFLSDEAKKHVSILFILLFLLMLILSTTVFVVISFTNIFNANIVNELVLRNDSKALEYWINSPLKPIIKVYIFNYTNIDAVKAGHAEKIKVEEIGPIVYEETLERINLEFLDGDKITFYENRSSEFQRDLTPKHLNEDSMLYVPNIPLMLAIDKVQTFAESLGLAAMVKVSGAKDFHSIKIKDYLFGYTDNFIDTIKFKIDDFKKEKMGIIGTRRGVSTDNLTIYTGESTLDELGRIYAMNGQTKMSYWHTDECNEFRGSDGSQFTVSEIAEEKNLEIFIKSICRTFPLEYDREVTVLNGLPAKRYRPEPNVFGSSDVNEKNKCYCDLDREKCPPNGVFDASKCIGLNLLMSYPHFYEGDESLRRHFEGLNPTKEKHGTFADIHPRMAFPIGGASRMQVNFKVKPFSYASAFLNLPEDLILPICWFEISVEKIPQNLLSLVYNTTHSANATYLTIQYGSIICMFFSFLLVLSSSILYYKRLAGVANNDIPNCKEVVYVNKL
ncbi:hypothetical protein PVAND_010607 [Polypedilum vanderplanki]|uniref:Uncharacterized protein n=1 Tax=Polypedilum vanderplanki TaxID=319348 RepID=A0A9J6CHA1_POLVA|nr:hypothetical protein PVAND_010607 [Polypedilum vanderplanki]